MILTMEPFTSQQPTTSGYSGTGLTESFGEAVGDGNVSLSFVSRQLATETVQVAKAVGGLDT